MKKAASGVRLARDESVSERQLGRRGEGGGEKRMEEEVLGVVEVGNRAAERRILTRPPVHQHEEEAREVRLRERGVALLAASMARERGSAGHLCTISRHHVFLMLARSSTPRGP